MFVVIEGIEGSGKSTQAVILADRLRDQGVDVVQTREPTQSMIGSVLRQQLSDNSSDPHVNALLFAADRVEHVNSVVSPALEEDKVVICDRYKYSSLVYQSVENPDLYDWISSINQFAISPHVIIYLDLKPEVANNRVALRGSDVEKFDNLDILREVYSRYDEVLSDLNGVSIYRIDASQNVRDVTQEIMDKLSNHICTKRDLN